MGECMRSVTKHIRVELQHHEEVATALENLQDITMLRYKEISTASHA